MGESPCGTCNLFNTVCAIVNVVDGPLIGTVFDSYLCSLPDIIVAIIGDTSAVTVSDAFQPAIVIIIQSVADCPVSRSLHSAINVICVCRTGAAIGIYLTRQLTAGVVFVGKQELFVLPVGGVNFPLEKAVVIVGVLHHLSQRIGLRLKPPELVIVILRLLMLGIFDHCQFVHAVCTAWTSTSTISEIGFLSESIDYRFDESTVSIVVRRLV